MALPGGEHTCWHPSGALTCNMHMYFFRRNAVLAARQFSRCFRIGLPSPHRNASIKLRALVLKQFFEAARGCRLVRGLTWDY